MDSMHIRTRWLVVLAMLALVAASCTRGEPEDERISDPAGDPVEGGTVVVGLQQEPVTLNPLVRGGARRSTWMISHSVLMGAYRITPDLGFEPDLIDGEAEVNHGEEFTVTWRIRDEAVWSDGTAITADDFQFTYDTIMDGEWDIATRSGYELITDTERVDDRTWRATFSEPFAAYRTLFTIFPILPAHVLTDTDFGEVWTDGIVDPASGEPIASGPFQFDERDVGRQISVVRNEAFWGDPATLERITFRYLDPASLVEGIDEGEIQLLDAQPSPDLVGAVEDVDGVELQSEGGLLWEHLYFNLDNAALANGYVREAIIRGLDREAIVEQLLGEVHPEAEVLQNVLLLPQHEHHEQHWDRYEHDPDAAVQLLEEGGCTRDDEEQPFECDGEELTFRYVSTAGNDRREQLFDVVASQLADIGVRLEEDFSPPRQSLSSQLPDGDFDIINFGWSGGPDPSAGDALFRCDGEFNYNGYCNDDVDELLADALGILDQEDRAAAYNDADELIARDLPLVPLYQVPEVLAHREHVGGVRVSAAPWGPTWNAGEWFLTEDSVSLRGSR